MIRPGLWFWGLAALALLAGAARADVLPPDSRFVEQCARIENAEAFPDVVLVAVVDRVDRTRTVSVVAPGQCLTRFYKFNRFRVFAAPRELAGPGGLQGLDFGQDPRLLPLSLDIDPSGFFVSRKETLKSVETVYLVLGFSRNSTVAYKSSETRRHEDGRAVETVRFPAPSAEGLARSLEPR